MSKKLHVASDVIFDNPYVVRVNHTESTNGNYNLLEFRKILKLAKELIHGTWGYSNAEYEELVDKSDVRHGGLSIIVHKYECRSYWVFKDNIDALQFRLTVGDKATHVHMWPTKIKFTITEYTNDDNK